LGFLVKNGKFKKRLNRKNKRLAQPAPEKRGR
jgi:hypothetical protein